MAMWFLLAFGLNIGTKKKTFGLNGIFDEHLKSKPLDRLWYLVSLSIWSYNVVTTY